MFDCTDCVGKLGDQTNIPGGSYLALRTLKCDNFLNEEHNSVI